MGVYVAMVTTFNNLTLFDMGGGHDAPQNFLSTVLKRFGLGS